WSGYARRVDSEMLADIGPDPSAGPNVYVCGPTSFVETVADALVHLGHEPRAIKTERFGATGGWRGRADARWGCNRGVAHDGVRQRHDDRQRNLRLMYGLGRGGEIRRLSRWPGCGRTLCRVHRRADGPRHTSRGHLR